MHTYCTFVNTCIIDLYLPNEVMGVVVQQAHGLAKWRVMWLIELLCFLLTFVLADRLVLLMPRLTASREPLYAMGEQPNINRQTNSPTQ